MQQLLPSLGLAARFCFVGAMPKERGLEESEFAVWGPCLPISPHPAHQGYANGCCESTCRVVQRKSVLVYERVSPSELGRTFLPGFVFTIAGFDPTFQGSISLRPPIPLGFQRNKLKFQAEDPESTEGSAGDCFLLDWNGFVILLRFYSDF